MLETPLGFRAYTLDSKKKKIDVYRDNVKIASIGDSEYLEEKGEDYAKIRGQINYKRHKKDIEIKGSPGYLSSILLW